MSAFHDLKLTALDGQELPLAPFKGQVVLVVNVASKCGLTPQYAALENLYQQFKGKGFSVLGLPCNQFAGQEPGTEQQIQEFCSLNYGVTFPLSSKLEVNGHDRHQLYRLLAGEGAEFPGISPGTSRNSCSARMAGYWRDSRRARRRMIRPLSTRLKKRWAETQKSQPSSCDFFCLTFDP